MKTAQKSAIVVLQMALEDEMVASIERTYSPQKLNDVVNSIDSADLLGFRHNHRAEMRVQEGSLDLSRSYGYTGCVAQVGNTS